ncbi:hypothetical protein AAFF_G00396400 [Aldrovandia affinis]|uniref:Cryptochrome/DNA photolyase FAD-binding domain-containing protein n=1 Tax=Aldrovandia affinis TaxID=143900 RepID=A0AAD7SDC3_9TELE|nr:hypothetical protein AAFF_G00396400 [Aldrovandia affinis]
MFSLKPVTVERHVLVEEVAGIDIEVVYTTGPPLEFGLRPLEGLWCPELVDLPDNLIHRPWQCPASILCQAGMVLSLNYPEWIVTDLEERQAQ